MTYCFCIMKYLQKLLLLCLAPRRKGGTVTRNFNNLYIFINTTKISLLASDGNNF